MLRPLHAKVIILSVFFSLRMEKIIANGWRGVGKGVGI